MNDGTQDVLLDAIARNSAAVISLPSAGMLRHCTTRLLIATDEGFYAESIPQETGLVDELIARRTPVGVACRSAVGKIIFSVPILRRQPDLAVSEQLRVDALLLPMPQTIKAVQRRATYRVQIPEGLEIEAGVWRITDKADLCDRPAGTLLLPSRIFDLSIGGVTLLCPPKNGEPVSIVPGQRLRIQVQYEQWEVLLVGHVRHARQVAGKHQRLGVQFTQLDKDLTGRQALSRLTAIVGHLQRLEVRRMHLGW